MTARQEGARCYPAGLRLAGRRVVVVGAGAVAQRRLGGLLAAGAIVTVIAPKATAAIEAMAEAGEVTLLVRPYASGDLALDGGAWYALAAADDAAVNEAVASEAEERRIFCARADDATGGSAWTPAVGRHGAVTVAVLTDGVTPAGGEADETSGTGHGDPRRSAALRDAVVEGLRDGTLAAPRFRGRAPGVALVGGGPGEPDLITVRGRRLLAEADVVVTDRLAPRELLDELSADVEVIDASKIPYGRSMPQEVINRVLIEAAQAGKFVVRLKGGDPYVFGRGLEELAACAEAGVPCTVVPGVTSGVAVPGLAGIPVTHRGVAHEFTVVSGHVAPDDPRSLVDWAALARLRGTLVLLMAVEQLGAIATALIANGRPAETPVAVVQDGTTPNERRLFSTLTQVAADVSAAGIRPPAIVVIGDVVRLAQATRTPD